MGKWGGSSLCGVGVEMVDTRHMQTGCKKHNINCKLADPLHPSELRPSDRTLSPLRLRCSPFPWGVRCCGGGWGYPKLFNWPVCRLPFRGLIYSYTLKITNSRDMLANTRNLLALIASMHTMGVVAFFQYGISLR